MRILGALLVAAGVGLAATASTTAPAAAQAQIGVWFGTPFYEPYPYPRWYGRYYEPRWHGRYHEPAYRPYRSSWRLHVNWCFDRYRSYDADRDAFRGYDGRWHKCNSPYG